MRNDQPTIAILCGGGLTHASGGIGRLSAYLLDAWAAEPDGRRHAVIDTRGVGGRLAGIVAFARAASRLAAMSASGRLALVHANMSTRGSAVRKCLLCRAAQLRGVPTVMHMHGADLHEFYRRQNRPFRAFIATTVRRSSRVIVLGAFWRDFLVSEMGIPPDLVAVVPNGVPGPLAAPAPKTGGVVRIVFLGRLGERKGVPELLAALALLDSTRQWHATLAGDGEIDRFRNQADALGLGDRVDLPGWLDRAGAARLLAQADIFVLPSHHEGMPLALLEAFAHASAVVATPVGSNDEFLTHGENALLVRPGDPVALSAAIGRLVDDAALRRRLGANARSTFEQRLEIGAIARRIAAIHADALRTRTRHGRSA